MEMCQHTHLAAITKFFNLLAILSGKKTHAPRSSGARDIHEHKEVSKTARTCVPCNLRHTARFVDIVPAVNLCMFRSVCLSICMFAHVQVQAFMPVAVVAYDSVSALSALL